MFKFLKNFIFKNIISIVLILIILLLTFFSFSYYKKYSNRTKIDKKVAAKEEVSFLLTSYNSEKELVFSMMSTIYPKEKKISLYFINPMISFNEEKIEKKGKDASDLLAEKIESILDKKIQYNLKISEKNFERIIDILGGVPIYFDPNLLKKSKSLGNYEIGEYILSGRQTLNFVKLNSKENPFDYLERLTRQEILCYVLFDKIQKIGKSIKKEWLFFIANLFDSSFSVEEFISIYEILTENKFAIAMAEMPSEIAYSGEGKSKTAYLKIKEDVVSIAFNKFETEFKSDDHGDGEFARIEVLNGTEINGLAKRVKILLFEKKRIKVLTTDNAWQTDIPASVILNKSGNTEYSRKVSEVLGINNIKYVFNKESGLDLTIVLGEDFEIKTGKK